MRFLICLAITAVVGSCGRADAPGSSADTDGVNGGAPTVVPVEVARTDTGVSIVEVTSLGVDTQGQMYVADFYSAQVTVFNGRGEAVRQLGRRGPGPGEFRHLRNLQVISGDSLFVYDSGNMRANLYAPAATDLARTIDAIEVFGLRPFHVWRVSGGYLVLIQEMASRSSTERLLFERLVLFGHDGRILRDSIFFSPSRDMIRVEVNSTSYLTPNPFGARTVMDVNSRGVIVHALTRDVAVHIEGNRRSSKRTIYLDHQPPPVVASDIDQFIESLPLDWAKPAVRRFLAQKENADRWPTIDHLIVDDSGRIWVQLGTRPRELAKWAVLNLLGELQFLAHLPPDAKIREVKGDRLYASRLTEHGETYVSVFEFRSVANGEAGAEVNMNRRPAVPLLPR